MVTKTTKYKSGEEFDVDRGLDLPEFDFTSYDHALGNKNKKKKDNPISEVLTNFKDGAKESIFNLGIVEKTLRATLPEEYGSALDVAQQGRDTVRSLYNQAVKELRPTIN